MNIKSLELANFRNYRRETFEFHRGTNVLYGDNAQGKTNVLEAVFVGATTKSHKGSRDQEMIKSGESEAHLRYRFDKGGRQTKVEVHMRRGSAKGISIDGLPIRNSSELLGVSNVVFFSPEDLAIVRDGPEARRHFIDMELCQLNHFYLICLTKYKKILKQRNALLKQIQKDSGLKDTLSVWNSQLVESGRDVIRCRREFVGEIEETMREKHSRLTGGAEEISLSYKPDCAEEALEEKMFLSEERDIFLGTTTAGPHRDDMVFSVDGADLRKYGSQGQKRTAALSLKMAEINMVESLTGESPILLLDDVLSELDRKRQNFLLENIAGIQTVLTCTGLEEFVNNGINIDRTFEIVNGSKA